MYYNNDRMNSCDFLRVTLLMGAPVVSNKYFQSFRVASVYIVVGDIVHVVQYDVYNCLEQRRCLSNLALSNHGQQGRDSLSAAELCTVRLLVSRLSKVLPPCDSVALVEYVLRSVSNAKDC